MMRLSELVSVANQSKTDKQKNAVGVELIKILEGENACSPNKYLFSNVGVKIERGKNLRQLGKGVQGTVFYGCLDDRCNTKIAVKVTRGASLAKMEYRIAEKLQGMGVPRMYYFKSCQGYDILYFEYITGKTFEQWVSSDPSGLEYKKVISQLMNTLYAIHRKYPSFRHHDLHMENILITDSLKPIIIDFGLSAIEGIDNPEINDDGYVRSGISRRSNPMYDVHLILNALYLKTKNEAVKNFVKDLFNEKYLGKTTRVIYKGRLRLIKHKELPTFEQILGHPFLKMEKKSIVNSILNRLPTVSKPFVQPKPKSVPKNNAGAMQRAIAIFKKKKEPLKRPRNPSVMEQVREIEARIKTPSPAPMKKPSPVTVRPKIFVNKNGDLKIDKRKCRLYKKEELIKLFKLSPTLTKDEMCKAIKNM